MVTLHDLVANTSSLPSVQEVSHLKSSSYTLLLLCMFNHSLEEDSYVNHRWHTEQTVPSTSIIAN